MFHVTIAAAAVTVMAGACLAGISVAQEQPLSPLQRADAVLAKADSVNVVAWGDSLTMGYGSRQPYPETAASYLHILVANMGFGGQTSTAIAARAGALPITLEPADGIIPRVGTTAIVSRSIAGVPDVGPLTRGGRQDIEGSLGGVPGVLHRTPDDAYSFSRNGVGDTVTCTPSCAFVPADLYRTRTSWIWAGRNGTAPGRTVFEDIEAIVEIAPEGRFLVAGFTTSSEMSERAITAMLAINATLRERYGTKFVDLLPVLLAASDGSQGDEADVEKGIVPRSLRVDEVHLTAKGYSLVAGAFVKAHQLNGY